VALTNNGFITLVINASFVLIVSPQKELSISWISIPERKQANSNNGFFPINSRPNNIKFGFLFSKNRKSFITISRFSLVTLI